MVRRVAVPDFVARAADLPVPVDFAAAGFAVLPDLAALLPALDVDLDLAPVLVVLDVDLDRAVRGDDEVPLVAGTLAVAIVLAAAVSDFAAVVMAFVAVFIACMAVDIVLADEVAFVAAAVILLAADVTFVAADETVRAAVAGDGAFLEPVDLLAAALVLALPAGRLAARRRALPLVDPRRLVAALRRVVAVVVRAGTDFPPSRSITEVLFHKQRRFTHLVAVGPAEQWPEADENSRYPPRDRAGVAPAAQRIP